MCFYVPYSKTFQIHFHMIEWVYGGDKMTIGQNIKTIRKEKKITQKALAQGTGIAEATIVRYEKEKFIPTIKQVEKIAEYLDVTPYDIMGVSYWNEKVDTESLASEVKLFEDIEKLYGENISSLFNDLLSLNPEGQEKASDYIDLLMTKYKK